MRKSTCIVGALFALTWVGGVQAAVVFTENFESGLGSWTNSGGGAAPTLTAPPSAPPDALGSTLSFVDPDGVIVRIGRAFTPNPAATSFKLTWYMYTNNVSSSTQRYYGQLSAGTAAVPGAGTGTFFRVAANNNANYQALYSNGATQTLTSTSPLAVGWHLVQLTVTPGAANVGSFTYQIDANAPVTTVSTGLVAAPTNVQLGQNATNGAAGAPDTSAWFDSIKVEQFAPAATKAINPNPVNGSTTVGINDDLSWTAGANNSFFDVFFNVGLTPTTQVVTNSSGPTTFDPGTLLPNTTYSWRVDVRNAVGDGVTGDVWTFTTTPEPTTLAFLGLGGLMLGRRRRA